MSYNRVKSGKLGDTSTLDQGCAASNPLPTGLDAASDPAAAYIDSLAVAIVSRALTASETLEPDATLGDFSALASILRSIVTRVGQAIPDVIAMALEQDGNFIILREYLLPLTRAAAEVVDNNRTTEAIELSHDLHTTGSYATDLIVIDAETRHAMVLECRRGGVAFASPRVAAALRTLRIAALTARRALEADGYRVASLSCGVIDRYGRAGYDPKMTVGPDGIDAAFDVPIRVYLDRLDERIREELSRRAGPILRGLLPHEPKLKPFDTVAGSAGGVSNETSEQRNEAKHADPATDAASDPPFTLSRFVAFPERRLEAGRRRTKPAFPGRLR